MAKFWIVTLVMVTGMLGCNSNNEPATVRPSLSSGATEEGTSIGNPLSRIDAVPFLPPSPNFEFKFCLTVVRFLNSATGEARRYVQPPTMLSLDPKGTIVSDSVGRVPIAFDTIVIYADLDCGTPYSIRVTNAQTTFDVTRQTYMNFKGALTPAGATYVSLNFQNLIAAAAAAANITQFNERVIIDSFVAR